jgi:hypothetical protein
MEEKNNNSTAYDKAKFLLIIVLIVSLGILGVNQFLSFRYKMIFTQTPCELCKELNPHLDPCFDDASTIWTHPETGEVISNEEYKKIRTENMMKDINLSFIQTPH